jgi:hypothetical protein
VSQIRTWQQEQHNLFLLCFSISVECEILTEEILQEEEKLHADTEKEDKKYEDEHQKVVTANEQS